MQHNVFLIINQLCQYFPKTASDQFINSPSRTECEIKQIEFTYRYDIYLILTCGNRIYEYGYDFIFDSNTNLENKYSHSKILLDNYRYFMEDDIQSNNDIIYYLNEILFELLTTICAMEKNEYQLAEILFVKSNQNDNKNTKQILKELGYFLRIIEWKKIDSINLEDLFDDLMLVDNKTGKKITIEQFTNIICEICSDKNIKYSGQKEITYRIFELLLLNITSDYNSQSLYQYKDTYLKAIVLLMESFRTILKMIEEINMRKQFAPEYINNLIMFHLDEYKNDIYRK